MRVIGSELTSTSNSAPGFWTLQQAKEQTRQNQWPKSSVTPYPQLKLDFDTVTSLANVDANITFTRAASGTYFDSNGTLQTASSNEARFDHRLENGVWVNKGLLIEESKTNLCLRSEEFNTTWTATNGSVTTNQIAAPDGTTTADLVIENTATNVHLVNQSSITITANTAHTLSVFVKSYSAVGTSQRYIRIQALSGSDGFTAVFSPVDGEVGASTPIGTGTLLGTSSQDCGNGWFRFSVSGIVNAASTTLTFQAYLRDAFTVAATYTGDNVSGLYLWGAQVEVGAFLTSYIKTTTAAINRPIDVATMTGRDFSGWFNPIGGTVYSLIDGQDPQFDLSPFDIFFQWNISDGTTDERMQLSNAYSSPPANLIRLGVTDGGVSQAILDPFANGWSTTKQYATAVAYKADDIAASTDGGSVVTDTSGTLPTVNRLSLGSHWLGTAFQLNGHIAKFYYWGERLANNLLEYMTSRPLYFDNTLVLNLNFDQVANLDSRITFTRATNATYFDSNGTLQTAGSGVARFDHRLESGVWVNKGLLIEEQRTNISQRSEEINNAYWNKENVTVTADDIAAPDGTTTAEKLLETTTNALHRFFTATPISINMTTANYSGSVFVKGGLGRTRGLIQIFNTGTSNQFFASFNISTLTTSTAVGGTGVAVASSIEDVGDGWYRVSVSGRTGANGNHQLVCYILNDVGASTYAGDVTKGLYWWGVQLEAGDFLTSYIKTTTASVTRNADVAVMTGAAFSSWFNATEGTAFSQSTIYYDLPSGAFPRIFEIGDGTTGERITGNYASDLPGMRSIVSDGGVNVASLDFSVGQSNGVTRKVAGAYKVNDFAGSVNGGTVLTDTSGTMPTVNKINFGSSQDNNQNQTNGHIAKFYYWNTRKNNKFLRQITL